MICLLWREIRSIHGKTPSLKYAPAAAGCHVRARKESAGGQPCYTSAMSVSPSPPRRPWRWLFILAASVVAHLLVMGWASGYLTLPGGPTDVPAEPLSVALLPPPPPKTAPPPPAPREKPKSKAKPRPRPAPAPATPPQIAGTEPAAPAATATETAEPNAGADVNATAHATSAAEGTGETPPAQQAPPVPWRADPPPPARLEYTVTALREGSNWYGSGRFNWQTDGDRYRISGEASVTILFRITVLNFQSEGRINPQGIMPERYSETPWRKDMAQAWFDRQAGRISFSSSAGSWPLQGGEQDRASVAWQLAALGRGDGSRFVPGGELEIVVAGARHADRWRFSMIGLEEVETPHGRHLAWHLKREPRGGRRDQGIDIWLAPQLEWYPVRVRHNYANGEFLDMSLSELHGAASPTEK
ncbi:DUF3108 domain-containing protein [Noviherbaspirillum aridicola]|uniref:DUF3108 domain-containing protein n=1 Tax=Noviherbaspirillum aridicola TaxID=2849687 RepID=A0ABQ4Q0W8_9BURK|nr:DUF3108 domain-containing protein [Noviherbaspirillum aridicola]GIZ50823.1 hypothetical protein NCCP691_08370 [Noviherbaspirillum aridicola]